MIRVLLSAVAAAALERLSKPRDNGPRSKAPQRLLRREVPEWFHVAYAYQLPGIARDGLAPGGPPTFEGFKNLKIEGRLFLTEAKGVATWYGFKGRFARESRKDPKTHTPLVLRYHRPLTPAGLDVVGTRDAEAVAVFTRQRLAAHDLSVWDGRRWRPVLSSPALVIEPFAMRPSLKSLNVTEEQWAQPWWVG